MEVLGFGSSVAKLPAGKAANAGDYRLCFSC